MRSVSDEQLTQLSDSLGALLSRGVKTSLEYMRQLFEVQSV